MHKYDNTQLMSIFEAANKKTSVFDYTDASQMFLSDNLATQIQAVEKKLLDAKGPCILIPVEGKTNKKIRVFDGDKQFEIQTQDLYARSLQHAYAMLKIAELEGSGINQSFIRGCLVQYTNEMAKLQNETNVESFKRAKDESINFIGIMCEHLTASRLKKPSERFSQPENEKERETLYLKAFKDIKKGIELYNMLEPSEDAICTVMGKESQSVELRISEKIDFEPRVALTNEDINIQRNSVWYKQNSQNHGFWFNALMSNENLSTILTRSPPCTTRDMPNPSNAWDEKTLYLEIDHNNNIEVIHQEDKVRCAISSPFNIKDKETRVKMAADSMRKLLSKERISDCAQQYADRWGELLGDDDNIPLYFLHQTLVAPTFFYGSDRNMMEVKRKSNEILKLALNTMMIEGIEVNGKIREVSCELGQVNNCINMWHPVIIPTDNDLNDSNKLIAETANLLGKFIEKLDDASKEKQDAILVKKYLDAQKRTWIPLGIFNKKNPTKEQKLALDRLGQCLINNDFQDILKKESQKDLALMCQVATHLKQLNHESQFGFAMRKIKNAIRIKEVPILAPVVGLALSPIYAAQYFFNTTKRLFSFATQKAPPRLQDVFFPTRNKQTAIAAYQNILGGKIGVTFGGCKSAFDREGEVKNHTEAIVQSFMQNGKVFDATQGDAAYYQYLNDFVKKNEESGHQNRIAAHIDRIGARKMWESRTHFYETSSKASKAIVRGVAAKFRKIAKIPTGEERHKMMASYPDSIAIIPTEIVPPQKIESDAFRYDSKHKAKSSNSHKGLPLFFPRQGKEQKSSHSTVDPISDGVSKYKKK